MIALATCVCRQRSERKETMTGVIVGVYGDGLPHAKLIFWEISVELSTARVLVYVVSGVFTLGCRIDLPFPDKFFS